MTPLPLPARRLTAGLALVALPLAAAVGCGTAATSQKQSVQTSLQKASDNLGRSGSASFVLRFEDPRGNLKKAATTGGKDPMPPAGADLLLGGSVSMTIDPADGRTLHDVMSVPADSDSDEQLKIADMSLAVQADGGPLGQIRVVGGVMYLNVGLDRIGDVARKSGSKEDFQKQLDEATAQAPREVSGLVADLRAGKWVKVPLTKLRDQLKALAPAVPTPTPTPSIDTQKLGNDLLAAVRPFVAVTEVGGSKGNRVLDVKVQAKQALKAVVAQLTAASPSLSGLSRLDSSGLDRIGDGTANGQVTLSGDHLKKMTLDLGSLAALSPPTAGSPAPDLSGGTVTLDVDDSAEKVTAPQDVSSADVTGLLEQLTSTARGQVTRSS